jgi:hypothetical protein
MTLFVPIATLVQERLARGRRRVFVGMGVWLGVGLGATAAVIVIPGEDPRGGILGLTLAILVAPPLIVLLTLFARPSVADLPIVAAFRDPLKPPKRLTVSYTDTYARVAVKLHDGKPALLQLPEEYGKHFVAWAQQQRIPSGGSMGAVGQREARGA